MRKVVTWRWLWAESPFCWGGHKSSRLAAFTFLALLSPAVKKAIQGHTPANLLSQLHTVLHYPRWVGRLCWIAVTSGQGWSPLKTRHERHQCVWNNSWNICTSWSRCAAFSSFTSKIRNPCSLMRNQWLLWPMWIKHFMRLATVNQKISRALISNKCSQESGTM